ncbi:MAG: serine protease [Pseudomonadota bacterium]
MRLVLGIFLFALVQLSVWHVPPAQAQQSAWVQIEAVPTLSQGQARAQAYAARLDNVHGFRLASGWYAIALGPFDPGLARAELVALRGTGEIPQDSYIAFSSDYRQPFWPAGVTVTPLAPAQPTAPAPQTPTAQPLPAIADETPQEARRGERLLTAAERRELQEALAWFGHYAAAIDGAFGPGTRRAMSSWQAAQGLDPTGVLTTRQRAELVAAWREPFDALGLEVKRDGIAGIEMLMPAAKVAYARTEAPFVHYDATDDSGMRLLLISQSGDAATLFGLYDIMQTLEIVPAEGRRERGARAFNLRGTSPELSSHTYARLTDGAVKGFTLVWRDADPRVIDSVVEQMRESFTPLPAILPDSARDGDVVEQSVDLLSGLDIRRPLRSRTGFFIDAAGAVLTTPDALAGCARVTLGADQPVEVAAVDRQLGLALLRPQGALAPIAVAEFQGRQPRLRSEVAVAGFAYGDALTLPVLTYGTLADLRGLAGEESLARLALTAQPGDAGGPVLDSSGAVIGMLRGLAPPGAQRLPEDVSFAVDVPTIAAFLSAAGVSARAADGSTPIAPEDLAVLASDIAVRVSCWN